MLMCGNEVTRSKAMSIIRNVDFIRVLVSICDAVTQGEWYHQCVGANILIIIREIIA